MRIVRTIEEVREEIRGARRECRTIGFVPTMGYLHDGHLSLFSNARASGADYLVASIFVNPTQFGPNEDFARYPRDEARDVEMLKHEKVDLLFAPPVEVIYPEGFETLVNTGSVSEPLEGERRPGHFSGVATIVLKLFQIITPDLAVFGQKDAQQCAVVSRMVRDLDVPVRLVFAPTLREADSLARSSRNHYLSPAERALAPSLHAALSAGEKLLRDRGSFEEAEKLMATTIAGFAGVQVDYLRVVDPETFRTPSASSSRVLLVGAVRIGRTRLIDNLRYSPEASSR